MYFSEFLRSINMTNINNVSDISNDIPLSVYFITDFPDIPNFTETQPNVIDNNLSNIFIPASDLIERLFTDYIENKNKLNEEEYMENTVKIHSKLEECPICFNSSETGIKITQCQHVFCEDCIKNWLQKHKNTCPICRTNVIKKKVMTIYKINY